MMKAAMTFLGVWWILSVVSSAQILSRMDPDFGFAGSLLDIEGTALQNADIIFGDDTLATVLEHEEDTRIRIVVPPNPDRRPGLVAVRARLGESWSDTLYFLYLTEARPAPVIHTLSQSCVVLGYEQNSILIYGEYFGSQAVVSFGSTEATVTTISPTLLEASVPRGEREGAVDLTFTNTDNGQSTRLASGFAYFPLLPPSITSVDPGPAVAAFSLRVTGAGFVPGATSVRLADIDLLPEQVTVDDCSEVIIQVPDTLSGPVPLQIRTPGGTATAQIVVESPASPENQDCALAELYGRRWREPETSAFHRGEFAAGRLWMRVVPQCQGSPPRRPELRLRAVGTPTYQLARDCNPSPSSCLPNQGRTFELRALGPFQEPRNLDIEFRCSNGIATQRLNFFTLYVAPSQISDRFTSPSIVDPGGVVRIRAKDLVQPGVDGRDQLVAPQKIKFFVREGLPSDHRIVWWQDYAQADICFGCLDRPVRIDRDETDPSGRTYVVTLHAPNVPNVIGRDVFLSLISERSDCRRLFVDQSSFPTLLFHVRAPGSFDLALEPDTPIHFLPPAPLGTQRHKTVRVIPRQGPQRYSGDVRIEAFLEAPDPISRHFSVYLEGSREEEVCEGRRNCRVIYLPPDQSDVALTLTLEKVTSETVGLGQWPVRVQATYPPRENQFTHETLIDLFVSPELGLLPASGALTEGRAGVGYDNQQIQAQGGAPGYRWYFCNSTEPAPPVPPNCLPNGLAIQFLEGNSRLRIYGTPLLPEGIREQNTNFNVRVRDQTDQERTATYSIAIRRSYVESFAVLDPRVRSVNTACGNPSSQIYTIRITTRNFSLVPLAQRNIHFTILEPADPSITLSSTSIYAPDSGSSDITLTVPSSFIATHPSTGWNIVVQASGLLVPVINTDPSGSLTINPSHTECLSGTCQCVGGAGSNQCPQVGQTCAGPPTHLECVGEPGNRWCRRVEGPGPDTCQQVDRPCCIDADCIQGCCGHRCCIPRGPEEPDENIVPIP